MKKVLFDTKKIQKLGRIQLNPRLLDNLNLQVGDELEIYLDTNENQIILKKKNKRKND